MSIENFNFVNLKPNSTILIYGAVCFLNYEIIKQFIYQNLDIPAHVVISHKESYYQYFSNFINKSFIYDFYDKSIYRNLVSRYKLLAENINKKSVLIIDEYSHFKKSKSVHKIISRHKTSDITLFITHNYPIYFFDSMNSYIDFVFLEFAHPINTRKRYFESYGKFIFNSFDEFNSILNLINKDQIDNFGIGSIYLVVDMKQLKYYKLIVKQKQTPEFKTQSFDVIF